MVAPARALGATSRPYPVPTTITVMHGQRHRLRRQGGLGRTLRSLLDGQLPLRWAPANVVYDSPDKKAIEAKEQRGRLMSQAVERADRQVGRRAADGDTLLCALRSELNLLKKVRRREPWCKVLTNSLESATSLAAQSGYAKDRFPLAQAGVQFYEIRALLDSTRGSGQTRQISRYGNYGLHAKLYVFDRERLFIGSWNFDERSLHINTEIGLYIDDRRSPAGRRTHRCHDAARQLPSMWSWPVTLRRQKLTWETEVDHHMVRYSNEPSRGWWQNLGQWFLDCCPCTRSCSAQAAPAVTVPATAYGSADFIKDHELQGSGPVLGPLGEHFPEGAPWPQNLPSRRMRPSPAVIHRGPRPVKHAKLSKT